MLNKSKFHFIICYDNELYMQECMKYISFLEVPDGVEIDVIGIAGADSIAAGYNAAMKESDAKYKVYLQQDVFIMYKHFIQDVLNIFKENPEYGMLGVLGSDQFVKDADYQNHWNIGMIDCCNLLKPMHLNLKNPEKIESVSVISGVIMITQEDIIWREDIFKGFCFYDISQSIEFQKQGYKIGIPYQNKVWCNYNCRYYNFEKYKDREIFCKEYKQYGYQYIENKEEKKQSIWNQEVEELLPLLEQTIVSGELEKANLLIDKALKSFELNSNLSIFQAICKIMLQEKALNKMGGFYKISSISRMIEQFFWYRALLRRLEYDKPIEDIINMIEWVAQYEEETLTISQIVAEYSVCKVEKVMWKLAWFLEYYCRKNVKIHLEHMTLFVPNISQMEEAFQLCKILQMDVKKLLYEIEDKNNCTDLIEFVYNRIDKLNDMIYIVDWSEKFYKGYLDIIINKMDSEQFLIHCQNWLEQAINYLHREETWPLISIIIPVYNGESFVEDTLRSIMEQSYQNLQIIVVDDCSKDNSRQVIDRLAEQDSRIEKVYLKRNSNICVAANIGYKRVKGKYFVVTGHDDIWKIDKIKKQLCFMEMNPDYAVCFTLCDIIDDEKQICNEKCRPIFQQKNRTQKEWVHTLFFKKNVFCASSALIRKECMKGETVYQYSFLQLQDYALWLSLIVDFPVYVLQEKLTLYRQFFKNSNNLSTLNEGKGNRTYHENNFILKCFLEHLSDEKFRLYFSDCFLYKDAYTPDELNCEKAFLLKQIYNFYCLDMFMKLLEIDHVREILENTYNFQLNDFYNLNMFGFPYNYSEHLLRNKLELVDRQFEEYKKLIEKQEQQIKQLKKRK